MVALETSRSPPRQDASADSDHTSLTSRLVSEKHFLMPQLLYITCFLSRLWFSELSCSKARQMNVDFLRTRDDERAAMQAATCISNDRPSRDAACIEHDTALVPN